MECTIARVKNPQTETLPETYQTFVIKLDGKPVGKMSYDRGRWKNAGGPAWCARFDAPAGPQFTGGVSLYNKNKNTLLQEAKAYLEREYVREAAKWVPELDGWKVGEQAVYRDECQRWITAINQETREYHMSQTKGGSTEFRARASDLC